MTAAGVAFNKPDKQPFRDVSRPAASTPSGKASSGTKPGPFSKSTPARLADLRRAFGPAVHRRQAARPSSRLAAQPDRISGCKSKHRNSARPISLPPRRPPEPMRGTRCSRQSIRRSRTSRDGGRGPGRGRGPGPRRQHGGPLRLRETVRLVGRTGLHAVSMARDAGRGDCAPARRAYAPHGLHPRPPAATAELGSMRSP